MIINMSGGRVGVQFQTFSIDQVVTSPDYFNIPNISVPGGVLKGFVLLKDNNTNVLQNNQIAFVYSDENQFIETGATFEIFKSSDGGLHKTIVNNGAVQYDAENQTLKILAPLYEESYIWYTGQYCLFVW